LVTKPVLVAGAGSWGTALAITLARNNYPVYLWDIVTEHIHQLQEDRSNQHYLPDIDFPDSLKPVVDITDHLTEIDNFVIAVPCSGLRAVLKMLAEHNMNELNICLACKGFEENTQSLNHQIVYECLGDNAQVAVISGPSFAAEVARGLPTAVTIASENKTIADNFANLFHSDVFRIYTHDDVIGVQVGGAIKNVMAIAAGIADGLGYGANTRAALITRGLTEIIRLGVALGGRTETFMGLAGLGDLVLTCTDDQSRNRRLGLALAIGKSIEQAQKEIGQAIEGAKTVSAVMTIAQEKSIEMPISEQVNKVLLGQATPRDAVQSLLSRNPKEELG
jgi:glycerol-3-phosphate dehydrogenase (NAD(P)+)